jgi:transcription factor IIIB 90 kDa subunit
MIQVHKNLEQKESTKVKSEATCHRPCFNTSAQAQSLYSPILMSHNRVSFAEEEDVVEEDYDAVVDGAAAAALGTGEIQPDSTRTNDNEEEKDDDEENTQKPPEDSALDLSPPPAQPRQTKRPNSNLMSPPPKRRATNTAAASSSSSSNPNTNNSHTQQPQLCCPNCGGRAIEQHEASGASICTDCGVVVEENAIVSSVEFMEGANGGHSSMVGQFVSATSSKAYTGGGGGSGGSGMGGGGARGGGRYGFARDSRETTLANGRRRIMELASRLRLSGHFADGAHRLFTVAVEKNFVQGRRTTHVVATCLYMACRQEKSPHMLIDFSDALQVNVYSLGTCFLKFRRLLGLKLEIIDPALYVYRFAAHLDLDDKANAVSLTALRLVARMQRDWIVAGRRPAGICAAALLIAARAHGLDHHTTHVTRILRVCGMTVSSRVREFEQTPSAQLTLEQFAALDFLNGEADPPSFARNKMREARAKAIQEGNVALLTSGALDDSGKFGSKWRELRRKSAQQTVKYQQVYSTIEKKLTDQVDEDNSNECLAIVPGADANDALETVAPEQVAQVAEDWRIAYPKAKGKDMIMPHEATAEEQLPSVVPTEAKLSLAEWKQNLPASIDEEIDEFFRTEEEEQVKEAIFNKINKDYIAQQERKENERMTLEAAHKDQEQDDLAQAAGQARYKEHSRSKKQRGRDAAAAASATANDGGGGTGAASTTEEQLRAAVAARKVSRKINYDALSSLFDDDGSFATDAADEEEAAADDDLLFHGL